MLSEVGQVMVLVIVEWEEAVFGVNLGHPIVTQWSFVA